MGSKSILWILEILRGVYGVIGYIKCKFILIIPFSKDKFICFSQTNYKVPFLKFL